MSEVKDQIILFLQDLIMKRSAKEMATPVSSLVGSVSQFKEFKEWLQNNFKGELKLNLLKFLQSHPQHFHYDFNTGHISVTNVLELDPKPSLTSIVMKPKLFNDLENGLVDNKVEDNLFVLELIIFIIQEVDNQSVCVSDLMQSIEKNCDKQFKCLKAMIKPKQMKFESEINDFNSKILVILITVYLKPYFTYDTSLKTLTIDFQNFDLDILLEFLTKTSLNVIKNCLIQYLHRFGRNNSFELNFYFQNKFKIVIDFIEMRGLTLDLIIGLYPEVFNLRIDENKKSIELNPKVLGETRALEFQLMYKYGTEIKECYGIVTRVEEYSAKIQTDVDFTLNNKIFRPEFNAIYELVYIYGQQVFDFRSFIHSGDRIRFDVKFVNCLQNITPIQSQELSDDLWTVTRIYNVKHSAQCFVVTIFDDWKIVNSPSNSSNSYSEYDSEEYND